MGLFDLVWFLVKWSFPPRKPALSFAKSLLLCYDITSYLLHFSFVLLFYFMIRSPSAWAETKQKQSKQKNPKRQKPNTPNNQSRCGPWRFVSQIALSSNRGLQERITITELQPDYEQVSKMSLLTAIKQDPFRQEDPIQTGFWYFVVRVGLLKIIEWNPVEVQWLVWVGGYMTSPST